MGCGEADEERVVGPGFALSANVSPVWRWRSVADSLAGWALLLQLLGLLEGVLKGRRMEGGVGKKSRIASLTAGGGRDDGGEGHEWC